MAPETFGRWSSDEHGLPCFDLASELDQAGLILPEGGSGELWHQVGNDSVTATAHAGGAVTLYSTAGGFIRLSGDDPASPRSRGGLWSLVDAGGREVLSSANPVASCRWGVGYARWTVEDDCCSVVRTVSAPFGDLPALKVDVEVRAPGTTTFVEKWCFEPYPVVLGGLMSRRIDAPVGYPLIRRLLWHTLFTVSSVSRYLTEMLRCLLGRRLRLTGDYDPALGAVVLESRAKPPSRPSPFAYLEEPVFVAALGDADIRHRVEKDEATTKVSVEIPPERGVDTDSLSFVVGMSPRHAIADVLTRLAEADDGASARSWSAVADFEAASTPGLARETRWHAYYLRSARVKDAAFESTYVPQGSAYGFIHGLQGTPRDYALSAVPLTYIDPDGAKDLLRTMMRMTRSDGAVYYSHTGRGYCTSALAHPFPTDLPIFFLWALTEYAWAAGDTAFLDERLPFYGGGSATTLERALLAWRYIRDRVGLGEHGMLRVGSGDWSDPISQMVGSPRAFKARGESAFNTAMAVYVLPRAALLLEERYTDEAAAIREYAGGLRLTMEEAWTGRWFLRGFDGLGGPIGRDHLFLDANAWCLVAGVGGRERCRELAGTIDELCDTPSPIGATILDRPHPVRLGLLPEGWDCNGGVWAAINALLAWGYTRWRPEAAWRSLEKQSLAAHHEAYPRVWYGIWSGPDACNAHYAERPGETFVQPATPMREFPVMNSNAHAGPLLAMLKVLGIEAGPGGIELHQGRGPDTGHWRLRTALFDAEYDELGAG